MDESTFNLQSKIPFPDATPIFEDDTVLKIRKICADYDKSTINWNIHRGDGGMANPTIAEAEYYVDNSRSAFRLILKSMLLSRKTELSRILDMPCGHGRVARHLVAAFPQAQLTACDLDESGVKFCADEFGAKPVVSKHNLEAMSFPDLYDLIWCGSLFSHLPKHKFSDCIRLFSRSLAPGGIAIFTTHGRFSTVFGRGTYLTTAHFDVALAQFNACGFGYVDYPNMPHEWQNNYGIALSSMSFISDLIQDDSSVKVIGMLERAWDDHQDAIILQKTSALFR